MPSNGAPKRGYREIAADLRSKIESGEWTPGSRLPSENDLIATYGVERPTARHALDVLKNEGLVQARRGAGTFVREFRPRRRVSPARLRSAVWQSGRSVWSDEIGDQPFTVRGLTVDRQRPPAHIAEALSLGDGLALVRRRTFVIGEQPVQLATSYYPAALVDGSRLTDRDTGPGGAYARLAELGYPPAAFQEKIHCRMPHHDETAALALPQGTPVIHITRTAFTEAGAAVEVNEMTLDAGSYVLEYHFTP
jgi:GntR family transcriptional regulator